MFSRTLGYWHRFPFLLPRSWAWGLFSALLPSHGQALGGRTVYLVVTGDGGQFSGLRKGAPGDSGTPPVQLPETLLDLHINLSAPFLSLLRTPRIGQPMSLAFTTRK